MKELVSELNFLDVVISAGIEGESYLKKLRSEGSSYWINIYKKDPLNFEIQPDGSLKFKKEIEEKIRINSSKKDTHGGGYEIDGWGRRIYRKGKK